MNVWRVKRQFWDRRDRFSFFTLQYGIRNICNRRLQNWSVVKVRSIVFRLSWGVDLWLVAVGLMSPAAAQTERVVDVEASHTERKQPARTIAEWRSQIDCSIAC
ncbi:hypothetical protein ABN584_24270 [Gloeocapsa sp. BRSZ]